MSTTLKQTLANTIKNLFTTFVICFSLVSGLSALSLIPKSDTIKELLSTVTQPVSASATGNCSSGYTYVGKDICRKIITVQQLADASYPCTLSANGGITGAYLYSVSNHVGTCYHDIVPVSFTCPAGQYLPTQGTDSCTPCDAGYYCLGGTGVAAVKVSCIAGNYCPGGSVTQVICPADYACPINNQTFPQICNIKVTSNPGSTACTITTVCTTGQYFANNFCSECPPGNYCPGGSVAPITCPASYFCFSGIRFLAGKQCPGGNICPQGTSTPTQCTANTYCPGSSTTETPCPVGTTSVAGTGSLEGCIPNSCPIGQTLTAGVCALSAKPYGDVKYFVNDTAPITGDVTGTPGGTVTQRVYYDNTTTGALTDVSVKTSLPVGFNYIPGSLKHCKEPTLAETTCDTQSATVKDQMFNKLIGQNGALGISPSAGFYDAADTGVNGTAPLSEKGILDAGKKRYLNLDGCHYNDASFPYDVLLSPNQSFGSDQNAALSKFTSGCKVGNSGNRFSNSYTFNFDLGMKKNLFLAQCRGIDQGSIYTIYGKAGTLNSNTLTTNSDTFTANSACFTTSEGGFNIDTPNSGYEKAQLLANRYLNLSQCIYSTSDFKSRILNILSPNSIPNSFFGSTFGATNTPTTAYNCGPGGNGYTLETSLSAYKAIDMLDTSRAKGYFEFKMIVPTSGLAASYSVPVVMNAKDAQGTVVAPVNTNGTINVIATTIKLKAYLSGPFNDSTDTLNNALRVRGLLPNSQPFNVAPFNYLGNESLPLSDLSTDICDWVLVEVRDSVTNTILSSKAALIKTDGKVIDSINATTANLNSQTPIDGVDLSGLTASGNYKVTLRHRNHLGISTNTPVTLTLGGFTNVDFSSNVNVKGNNSQIQIGTVGPGNTGAAIYGLRNSDANKDGSVDATDRNILNSSDEYDGVYDNKDLNLDGVIDASDRNISQNALEAVQNL